MSRASIRADVTAFLQPPAVAGLNLILRSQPKDLSGAYFGSGAPGESSGAIGVVFVRGQHDRVEAMDGAGGQRLTTYTVEVQVFHRSVQPTAEAAMDDFDAVIDAACTRLRSDPSLGLGVAQAQTVGLISAAYESLDVEFGEPEMAEVDSGWIDTWAVIRFTVLEWNQVT